jgi:hypothetical protein
MFNENAHMFFSVRGSRRISRITGATKESRNDVDMMRKAAFSFCLCYTPPPGVCNVHHQFDPANKTKLMISN